MREEGRLTNTGRRSQGASLAILLLMLLLAAPRRGVNADIPITGPPAPGMASFDAIIPALMQKWQIPGGSVGVVKDGRLVLARGYGWANQEASLAVQPDSLFRIASLTKAITAAAVFKLVEEGKLDLDAKAFPMLNDLQPPAAATVDSRIANITVRELLDHSGGWNRYTTFDPMFISSQAAQAVGAPAPASTQTVIRYMLGQPLQFDPGSQYSYSNFGYAVLGRVIEKVTGQSYEEYIRTQVLTPAGISCMRLARTQLKDQAAGEVHYYDYPGSSPTQSVFPDVTQPVPSPYGGFYIEAMDSHGGWLASIVDLLLFITSVDGRGIRPSILQPDTIKLMVSRPAVPLWAGSASYDAGGWYVRPVGDDANWWHDGGLPGATTFMVRAYNGLAWVALFNSRPSDSNTFTSELDNSLWQAVNGVTSWPTGDLFAQFGGCGSQLAAPSIDSALFQAPKQLSISGARFGDAPQVLINSVDQTSFATSVSDTSIHLKGKPKKLGLRPGTNSLQVIDGAGRASNVFNLLL